ncbi:MAG: hypothetical protein ACR2N8_02455 [Parvibaculales bacterium]
MRDELVGDVGDYFKYGLLRFLREHGGVKKLGVNWYKNEDYISTQGDNIYHLTNPRKYRQYDEKLFDALLPQRVDEQKHKQGLPKEEYKKKSSIEWVESSNLLEGAKFFDELVLEKKERKIWFEKSLQELEGGDLVFLDPDTGLQNKSMEEEKKRDYVLYDEMEKLIKKGHNILCYQHIHQACSATLRKTIISNIVKELEEKEYRQENFSLHILYASSANAAMILLTKEDDMAEAFTAFANTWEGYIKPESNGKVEYGLVYNEGREDLK